MILTRLPALMSSSIKTKGCFSFFVLLCHKKYPTLTPQPGFDYRVSFLGLVCQKSNVNPKRALKSYRWWVVHLDYNVSSFSLVCKKSNVNPKRALKSHWVGGGGVLRLKCQLFGPGLSKVKCQP